MTFINCIVLFGYFAYLYWRSKTDPSLIYIILPFVYQSVLMFCSTVFIESGQYIVEQDKHGYFNGSTIIGVFLFTTSFELIRLLFDHLNANVSFKSIRVKNEIIFIVLFTLLCLFILYFNLLQSEIPLLSSRVSRFNYWKVCKYPFLFNLFGHTSMFIAMCSGIIYCKKRKLGIFLYIIYLIYLILLGHKFSSLVLSAYCFFIFDLIINKREIDYKLFFSTKLIIIYLLLFGVVYYSYSQLNPYRFVTGDSIILAIFYRLFALQGHLWWGAMNFLDNPLDLNITYHEILYAMHRMMLTFSSVGAVDIGKAIEKGLSFTNAYPSFLFVYYSPLVALFIHYFTFCIWTSLVSFFSYKLITQASSIFHIIGCQVILMNSYSFTMGYFYKYFIELTLVILTLIIISIFQLLKERKWSK